jgi:H+-transporting ATPase
MEQDGLKGTKLPAGLSTAESQERLRQHGPNRVEEDRRHPLLAFLGKFWAPVPWMLEATIVLGILVHKLDEAVIIGCLLLFHSVLGFVQENQVNRALDLLRSRLSVQARVLRDGRWQLIPAEQLVPGDVIHLRLGDLAPVDVRLFDGGVEADESELTGELLAVEKSAGAIDGLKVQIFRRLRVR